MLPQAHALLSSSQILIKFAPWIWEQTSNSFFTVDRFTAAGWWALLLALSFGGRFFFLRFGNRVFLFLRGGVCFVNAHFVRDRFDGSVFHFAFAARSTIQEFANDGVSAASRNLDASNAAANTRNDFCTRPVHNSGGGFAVGPAVR